MKAERIALTGDGSWATALVHVLTTNGQDITWHVRTPHILTSVREKSLNCDYLGSLSLDTNHIKLTDNLEEAIESCDILYVVIPAAFIHQMFEGIPKEKLKGKKIVSAVKGMLPGFYVTPCTYFSEQCDIPLNNLAFISGPSHAEEVAMGRTTYLTALSIDQQLATTIANILRNETIITRPAADIAGAEYATVLKNIMALSVGICHGLGHGDNLTAVLVAGAIREIEAFLNKKVPGERNILDYLYTGDLLVTCYSQFSRNRTFGNMIGKGYSVKSAQMEMNMIAEGYNAVPAIIDIAGKLGINMPISETVYNILYKSVAPRSGIQQLIVNLH
ncbi:MAG: glycerol-3-phosphate dehydrogenase [Bacteroidetes bacterium HGW-Bacteroidetes-21]|jgi:glycerol-3-phosphate dehydrogenase (NAD(P)+)|nr:MAG: glycerol-3-phosphate dehydrogenase [Bacteroidetes bacterium HGW-Bacteroidetes-21]